jgi:hypothetical protein
MAKKFKEITYLQMYLEAQIKFRLSYITVPPMFLHIYKHHYTTNTLQNMLQFSHVNVTASLDCTHHTQSKLQYCTITDTNKKHKNQLNYVL